MIDSRQILNASRSPLQEISLEILAQLLLDTPRDGLFRIKRLGNLLVGLVFVVQGIDEECVLQE